MHKSRLGALVIDCEDKDIFTQAAFWAGAFGRSPESSEGQINPRFVRLDGSPSEVHVMLQSVDHPSRVHIDIETDNIDAEVQRLMALGAKVVETLARWVVMEAPSGHRFCVVEPIRADFQQYAKKWE